MLSIDRNGIALRGCAVFFAAFCVVASARALIPGLCATLADLDRESTAICVSPSHACCEPAPEGPGAAVSISAPESHCAFCTLTHAVAHLVSVPEFAPAKLDTPRVLAAHDFYVPNLTGVEAYGRRGPPVA